MQHLVIRKNRKATISIELHKCAQKYFLTICDYLNDFVYICCSKFYMDEKNSLWNK